MSSLHHAFNSAFHYLVKDALRLVLDSGYQYSTLEQLAHTTSQTNMLFIPLEMRIKKQLDALSPFSRPEFSTPCYCKLS